MKNILYFLWTALLSPHSFSETKAINFPPIIDIEHISPDPSRLINHAVSVGKNCHGQSFKIPPIKDADPHTNLYYLWFLDGELVQPQSIIIAEQKDSTIVSITINEHFLSSFINEGEKSDFYDHPHILEFYVADDAYLIPETRMKNDKTGEDKAYWIVNLSEEKC